MPSGDERTDPPALLILAYGNTARGDDGLGPCLLHTLQRWQAAGRLTRRLQLLEDFQLQPEHVLDLRTPRQVVFVDASRTDPPPYRIHPLSANPRPQVHSHALDPNDLLGLYREVYGPPPPARLLAVRGEAFDFTEELSTSARHNAQRALRWLARLALVHAGPTPWTHHPRHTA